MSALPTKSGSRRNTHLSGCHTRMVAARLNCIGHLLERVPYEPTPQEEIKLPERSFDPEYERKVLSPELYVPEKF